LYRLAQTLHGISFADFISDLNDGIPLSDACVETIIASDVLENIMKPYTFLAEMNSHLKDGGIAFINIPFMYCFTRPI
jgi:Methyltransferase domain